MRAGFASVVLAMSLAAVSLAGTAADTIMVVDFEKATGVDQLLGVENPGTPSAKNVGFEGFFWAWNGSGVVNPGNPAAVGFFLGSRKLPTDFDWGVAGSEFQFAYRPAAVSPSYITSGVRAFSFVGAKFSSTTPGTLKIIGEGKKAHGNGAGGGTYEDVPVAVGAVTFDGLNNPGTLDINEFKDRYVDRLVISSLDVTGNPKLFQWTLDDFAYAPVPEPGTWAMFGLGVLGVGFAVKRRKPRIR